MNDQVKMQRPGYVELKKSNELKIIKKPKNEENEKIKIEKLRKRNQTTKEKKKRF